MDNPIEGSLLPEVALLEGYCQIIVSRFKTLGSQERWKLLARVRVLAEYKSGSVFDFEQARGIRERLEISRNKLVELFPGMHQQTLYKYEVGRVLLDFTNETAGLYLKWLKENGYQGSE